ncbi:MAG: hypothetical protein DUD27_06610 [Lachnospiraceae bacterium]|uniref:Uncharacterized protein n=1 Tax=Candidatus Weimeria bifida TaxID=2599074 RepID=A0A6N7IWJ0_9FIRM|nr:hypothetical protein [Candidatus Weimeria bifida]RRF96057.1 MAG: hypothetical protein DUD27_06610 [Lachnospiraceae bacterium]
MSAEQSLSNLSSNTSAQSTTETDNTASASKTAPVAGTATDVASEIESLNGVVPLQVIER